MSLFVWKTHPSMALYICKTLYWGRDCWNATTMVVWSLRAKLRQTFYTVNPRKHTKVFLSYFPQNPNDSDKIWCTLSWINLRYSSLNIFQLTWIMLLHYLVKLSIHVLQVNSKWNYEPKNKPNVFCHIVYKTRLILIKFCTYCPEYIWHIINVCHLT